MESTSDKKVTDSCCLILRTLQIPNDIWFSYRRVVMVLFRILCNRNHDVVTQQNAITLLVIMATEVDKGQKAAVGDMGAVEVMPLYQMFP